MVRERACQRHARFQPYLEASTARVRYSMIPIPPGKSAAFHSDRTLRCTPAMAAGVSNRLWSVEELIAEALEGSDEHLARVS